VRVSVVMYCVSCFVTGFLQHRSVSSTRPAAEFPLQAKNDIKVKYIFLRRNMRIGNKLSLDPLESSMTIVLMPDGSSTSSPFLDACVSTTLLEGYHYLPACPCCPCSLRPPLLTQLLRSVFWRTKCFADRDESNEMGSEEKAKGSGGA